MPFKSVPFSLVPLFSLFSVLFSEAQGLIPGSRHHVHLSEDPQTALAAGKRYGQPVLLTVDTQAMCAAGTVFYQADNGVWLVDQVPAAHLSRQAEK
ncbi:RNA 2'-phosphotransferase [Pseudomonas mosselii]|uniref:RNA 2'-phosphotransferase n=1 Tax=Pseudomonas mosselii TaxID=78327 RepID=A0ABX9AZJ7_9PSED|nr:RNA 2'-phosphotransferase [Pseudomonas mosselii]MBH3311830.1 RNA 2'-phosphotransferase [Pseudomonas mosselii]MBH3326095.1 RNA 2'-phosphotransferase [Pseudomonas mosselii]QZP24244.1 RNA 2'-phosphotransferase [Pseudomonas mosselii]